ncbi:MAG: NADPH:quinone oxidoreductase family protein [Acidobacteria bacterium]|nr:NADPH:quinone oxidoreductase family protein [Acidobacteriota bacterium]
MKAMLCTAYGPPDSLVLRDVPRAPLGEHDVRIGVHAAGVNFPDLLIIQGLYQFKPEPPFAPGGEVAGEVLETGPAVTDFVPGDRVIGMTRWNGYAEEAVAPAHRCIAIPASADMRVAAGLALTYGTSYHALVQRASLQPDETLLVHGAAGGIGTAAIDIGQCLGARIVATGGNDQKLQAVAAHYGVEHVINYDTEPNWKDRVRALTDGRGADVICDPVGGDVFEKSLRCINWEGRLLVVGFTSGTIPSARANLVLLKGCSVVGVFWGAYADRDPEGNRANLQRVFRWLDEGRLRPLIARTLPLAEAAVGLEMLARREVVGKVILTTDRYEGGHA